MTQIRRSVSDWWINSHMIKLAANGKAAAVGRGLDELEAPVLEGSAVVAVKDDISVVPVLPHPYLNALVGVITVDNTVTLEQPHLGAVAGDVLVHHQTVTDSFTVKHEVHDHGVDDPVRVEVPQLVLRPPRTATESHDVVPWSSNSSVDLHTLPIQVIHNTERTSFHGRCGSDWMSDHFCSWCWCY